MLFAPSATQRILIIAAHPDDEILGCGGTLARLVTNGCHAHVLLLGEGPTSRTHDASLVSVKETAIHSAVTAAKELGITDVHFANLPDNLFDTIPLLTIIQFIEKIIQEVQPDLVFTHHAGDLNIDHTITHRATMTACRPLPNIKSPALLGFEVLSSTEYTPPHSLCAFEPTLFVDIQNFLEKKQKALKAYSAEMRPWPHPRSFEAVEHLARLRGSQCGREAAEAFVLYRNVL